MSDFTYDPEKHIVINRKVYAREDFSQEAIQGVSVINFADQQLASKNQELIIMQRGRDTMVAQLIEMLKDNTVLHEITEEEEATGEVK